MDISQRLSVVRFATGTARSAPPASGFPTRRTATPRAAPATSSPRGMWPKRPTPKPTPAVRHARSDLNPSRTVFFLDNVCVSRTIILDPSASSS